MILLYALCDESLGACIVSGDVYKMTKQRTPDEILKQLHTVATMVMKAAEADSLELMLQRIADIARQLIGVKYAALGVPDQKGGLKFFKVSGLSKEKIRDISHPPVGLGLLGMIMREKEAVRVDKIEGHTNSVGFPEGHPHMTSLLGVPIQLGDQLFGIFYLTDKLDGQSFTEDDQWLLEIMAGYAALVIAEKYISTQRRQITIMQEREQIGMALHDGVIQSIYAIGMRLDLAQRQNQVTSEDIGQTLMGLNQVIEDIRSAIFQLRDDSQQALTLRRRLNKVISQLYIPDEINVSLNFPEHTIPISENVMEALEMMANECLSNVIRHAKATEILITARDNGSYIELTVSDNGVGFPIDDLDHHQGLGLKNLERRARIHGGSVEIQSAKSNGTTVVIQIPLD